MNIKVKQHLVLNGLHLDVSTVKQKIYILGVKNAPPPLPNVGGFVFLPLHIYRRHLSSSVRKMCLIPNLPFICENMVIFSNKTFKVFIEKIHITGSTFCKYLEPRKYLCGQNDCENVGLV